MDPRRITVHCTALPYGTVEGIRRYHVNGRGWVDIGYHFVVTNGHPGGPTTDGVDRSPAMARDGKVWEGRPVERQGAGVRGENDDNIHVVLVGLPGRFSPAQLQSLLDLCGYLCRRYYIDAAWVRGHSEYDPIRACPGLEMELVRAAVRLLANPV